MPRATNAPASRNRRKRVIERASGFRGNRSKLFRYAKDATYKSEHYATRDRAQRKRQFRSLWITRITSAVKAQDLTYSRFIEGLHAGGFELDRKVLADLAANDIEAFNAIVKQVKGALEKKREAAKAAA
jgi:large subunit ribosomal protein L20